MGPGAGEESREVLGLARINPAIENAIRRSLAEGRSIRETAREMGVGNGTVERVKAEFAVE